MVQIYLISSNTTVSIMFCTLFNMLKVIYSIEILPLPVQKQTVHVPANRKRFHNVFVWLYRGFVATQRCLNVFITFSIRCGKVVLEPTTGKRCRNV